MLGFARGSGPSGTSWVSRSRTSVTPTTRCGVTDVVEDPRLRRTEILRVPRIGNPAAFSPEEWDAVSDLVDGADEAWGRR